MSERRQAGGLEAEVLAALWAAGRPLTTADVIETLDSGLAYNTVQTTLTRLLAKGAVHRELLGRAHAYTPVLDEPGLAAHRMRAVLDRGDDQAAVLSRFVDTLTPAEGATLARLLERERRPRRRS
jgi:predicted transcriptional regulator